ncbi:MAG TPA: AAA family ATPase [Candidatus Tumulicola sp.]|nr:AAA family ATPase [Candidatus Tumulicola sp.]
MDIDTNTEATVEKLKLDSEWQWEARSADDIAENPPPPPSWDAEGFLERDSGPVLWFGDSDSYKSWLALHVASCIASGSSVFGHFKSRKRINVYYINLDAGRLAFERRVCRLEHHPRNLYVVSASHWETEKFGYLLRENKDTFYVFDCWTDVYEPNASTEQARDMREAIRAIRAAFENHKANGIIVDHSKRQQIGASANPADLIYGSTQKKASFRQVAHISTVRLAEFEPGVSRVKFTCVKMNEAEKYDPFFVDLRFAGGKYTCTYAGLAGGEAADGSKAEHVADSVISHLERVFPQWVRPTELAQAVGLDRSSGTFRRAVSAAFERDSVESTGKSRALRYRFKAQPQAALDLESYAIPDPLTTEGLEPRQ